MLGFYVGKSDDVFVSADTFRQSFARGCLRDADGNFESAKHFVPAGEYSSSPGVNDWSYFCSVDCLMLPCSSDTLIYARKEVPDAYPNFEIQMRLRTGVATDWNPSLKRPGMDSVSEWVTIEYNSLDYGKHLDEYGLWDTGNYEDLKAFCPMCGPGKIVIPQGHNYYIAEFRYKGIKKSCPFKANFNSFEIGDTGIKLDFWYDSKLMPSLEHDLSVHIETEANKIVEKSNSDTHAASTILLHASDIHGDYYRLKQMYDVAAKVVEKVGNAKEVIMIVTGDIVAHHLNDLYPSFSRVPPNGNWGGVAENRTLCDRDWARFSGGSILHDTFQGVRTVDQKNMDYFYHLKDFYKEKGVHTCWCIGNHECYVNNYATGGSPEFTTWLNNKKTAKGINPVEDSDTNNNPYYIPGAKSLYVQAAHISYIAQEFACGEDYLTNDEIFYNTKDGKYTIISTNQFDIGAYPGDVYEAGYINTSKEYMDKFIAQLNSVANTGRKIIILSHIAEMSNPVQPDSSKRGEKNLINSGYQKTYTNEGKSLITSNTGNTNDTLTQAPDTYLTSGTQSKYVGHYYGFANRYQRKIRGRDPIFYTIEHFRKKRGAKTVPVVRTEAGKKYRRTWVDITDTNHSWMINRTLKDGTARTGAYLYHYRKSGNTSDYDPDPNHTGTVQLPAAPAPDRKYETNQLSWYIYTDYGVVQTSSVTGESRPDSAKKSFCSRFEMNLPNWSSATSQIVSIFSGHVHRPQIRYKQYADGYSSNSTSPVYSTDGMHLLDRWVSASSNCGYGAEGNYAHLNDGFFTGYSATSDSAWQRRYWWDKWFGGNYFVYYLNGAPARTKVTADGGDDTQNRPIQRSAVGTWHSTVVEDWQGDAGSDENIGNDVIVDSDSGGDA